MALWVREALRGLDLGDTRRAARLLKVVGDLAEHMGQSVPEACGDLAATKGCYRLFDNEALTREALFDAVGAGTAERCAQEAERCAQAAEGAAEPPWVLVVQDTTQLDFTDHRGTAGLGPIGDGRGRGLLLHSALAVSAEGVPLGLVDQQVVVRQETPGGRPERRRARFRTPIEEKESYFWLAGEQATLARLASVPRLVTVGDRGADIFDLFAQERREGAELLIRANHRHRLVADPDGQVDGLLNTVRGGAELAGWQVSVRDKKGQFKRTAQVVLRAAPVAVQPPAKPRCRQYEPRQPMWAVLVDEVHPPAGEKAVQWLLLTTLSPAKLGLDEAAAAGRVVEFYTRRWLIERYHFVLKSGCGVEELQLQTEARLARAVAVFGVVAWGVLWLTLGARATPEASSETAFARPEWRALWAFRRRGQPLPSTPPTLREAVREVAMLGGFLGRAGDGEPGPMTVWRGLSRLHDIAAAWLAFGPEASCG